MNLLPALRGCCLFACLWSGMLLTSAQTAEPKTQTAPPVQQQWHTQVERMIQQRLQLQAGHFQATTRISFPKTQPEEAAILFDAECWFADRFQKVRFDQTVKQPLLRYEEKPEIQTSLSTWIRTPEMSIHTEGNRTSVRIYEPDAHPGGYYSPFDVRVLGLVKTAELMQTQTRKRREHFFLPDLVEWLKQYQAEQIESTAAGLTEVTLNKDNPKDTKLILQFDPAQGYTPVSYRFYMKSGMPPQFHTTPDIQNHVTWQKRSNVWVPVQYESTNRWIDHHVTMRLKWLKVNQKIPAATFTIDALDLPQGLPVTTDDGEKGIIETQIIDHRNGQNKLIRGGSFISDEELEKP